MKRPNRRTTTPHANDGCLQKSADVRADGNLLGHGAKSESVRERAILALLAATTVSAAARRCGVNEKTLRRWMADDEEFKGELAAARGVMFEAGMGRVQGLTVDAVATLASLLGRGTPPNVRLGAARTVVELAIHEHDAGTILRRLADLEARQREQGARGGR